MKVHLEMSFRNVPKTDYLEKIIREKAAKLDHISNELISCRVAVERRQKHQQVGNPYQVRIDMRAPSGQELVVTRKSGKGRMHDSVETVLREAFDAARLTLKEHLERERGAVKAHPHQETMAFVHKLNTDEGYGFLMTPEGREIYFHRNSVLFDDFDRMAVGTGVRFALELGEKGPQASTVQIIDKPSSG